MHLDTTVPSQPLTTSPGQGAGAAARTARAARSLILSVMPAAALAVLAHLALDRQVALGEVTALEADWALGVTFAAAVAVAVALWATPDTWRRLRARRNGVVR